MKSLKKLFTAFAAGVTAVAVSASCAFAAAYDGDVIAGLGRIDWGTNTIIAEGTAAGKDDAPNPVIKKKQAETAAKVLAERNLVEMVNGVTIHSDVTVKNAILNGDVAQATVSGVIKGAKEVSRTFDEYGNCTVVMALPMFGENSLAKAVLPRTVTRQPFPALRPVKPAAPVNKVTVTVTKTVTTTITSDVKAAEPTDARPSHPSSRSSADSYYRQPMYEAPYSDPYTGEAYVDPYGDSGSYYPYEDNSPDKVTSPTTDSTLQPYENPVQTTAPEAPYYDVSNEKPVGNFSSLVVDCRGLEKDLKPVMSAVIRNTANDGIYGVSNLDYDLVTEKGMCSYTKDPTLAGVSRVGENPLVVHAVKLDDFGSTPFITVEDANRVLLENQATGFLDKLNVVFLR